MIRDIAQLGITLLILGWMGYLLIEGRTAELYAVAGGCLLGEATTLLATNKIKFSINYNGS